MRTEQGQAVGASWRELNRVLADALILAITGGFRFARDDFALMAKDSREGGFSFGYWARTDREGYGERFYTLACGIDRGSSDVSPHLPNVSACISFERWKARKPFFLPQGGSGVDRVGLPVPARGLVRHRLCVGFRLYWQDEWVDVTSIAADGESMTACSYHEQKPGEYRSRVKHRLTITRETLARIGRAIEAERKLIKKNDPHA
jgi:hypothetical protein